MRTARLQSGKPGKFTADEAAQWTSAEVSLVRKRIDDSDPSESAVKKIAKASMISERQASLDVINMSGIFGNHHR